MTDSVSAAILRVIAANAQPPVPLQDFIIKQEFFGAIFSAAFCVNKFVGK